MTFSEQIRELIIKPSLKSICLYTESAEILVYGTGLIESNYQHLTQIKGPALGMWQCEPATHVDIKKWIHLRMHSALLDRLLSSCYYTCLPLDDLALIHNLRYAALICRLHYFRVKAPLPMPDNAAELARYYKIYYNSRNGAANLDHCTDVFQRIIDGTAPKEIHL